MNNQDTFRRSASMSKHSYSTDDQPRAQVVPPPYMGHAVKVLPQPVTVVPLPVSDIVASVAASVIVKLAVAALPYPALALVLVGLYFATRSRVHLPLAFVTIVALDVLAYVPLDATYWTHVVQRVDWTRVQRAAETVFEYLLSVKADACEYVCTPQDLLAN